jgi:hypothetical protein
MPLNKEGHDPSFLLKSSFSRESGICPTACYRNAAPAVLYEKVGLGLLAWLQLKCGTILPRQAYASSTPQLI